MTNPQVYFFDSYAIIELLKGNPSYKEYRNALCLTTKLNLFEVYYCLLREVGEEEAKCFLKSYYSAIIDFDENVLISDTANQEILIEKCFIEENIEAVEQGNNSFIHIQNDDEYFICSGVPIIGASGEQVGTVLSSLDMTIHAKSISANNYTIIGTLAALFVLVILGLAFFLFYTITFPIRKLTMTADKISKGETDVVINPDVLKSKDEIGDLARAFERTMTSLKLAMRGAQNNKFRIKDDESATEKNNKQNI